MLALWVYHLLPIPMKDGRLTRGLLHQGSRYPRVSLGLSSCFCRRWGHPDQGQEGRTLSLHHFLKGVWQKKHQCQSSQLWLTLLFMYNPVSRKWLTVLVFVIEPLTIFDHGSYFFQPFQFSSVPFGFGNVVCILPLLPGGKFFEGCLEILVFL